MSWTGEGKLQMWIGYYFADVVLPDETDQVFANEAGRQAIASLVDSHIEWDDFAIEAPPGAGQWLGTDASEIPEMPTRTLLANLLTMSGLRVLS